MSKAQTIKSVGLYGTLGLIAVSMAVLYYIGRRVDPLFAKAINRVLAIGLVLLAIQIVGFVLIRR